MIIQNVSLQPILQFYKIQMQKFRLVYFYLGILFSAIIFLPVYTVRKFNDAQDINSAKYHDGLANSYTVEIE